MKTGVFMQNAFQRTESMIGKTAMEKLAASRVAIFGLGGVGGYVAEGLVRSGVGALDLIDHDKIDVTNLNRQIIATTENIGEYKADEAAKRALKINPDCKIRAYKTFFLPETQDEFDFSAYDYVVDAIDTVSGKLALIECAKKAGVKIISAMGAGNKLDPTAFRVADVYDTSVCPLAKVMRRECRKRGIDSLKTVYSQEEPFSAAISDGAESRKPVPSSVAFVPSVVGMIIAGEVVKDLIK